MTAAEVPVEGDGCKDAALSEDIRLLGRLLGDVVRDQAGDEVFDARRGRPPARRRRPRATAAARSPAWPRRFPTARSTTSCTSSGPSAGSRCWPTRPRTCTTSAAGAFHRVARLAAAGRQRRGHARSPRSPPGVDADGSPHSSTSSLVVPVITAHPTEVRRQTVLDLLADVASLLDRAAPTSRRRIADRAELDERCGVLVLTLWQTAMLRMSKLRVADEINEALRYYDRSLFGVVPELERDRRTARRGTLGRCDRRQPAPCAWARGSAATATATRSSPPTCCAWPSTAARGVALDHHLAELRRLARELSMSARLVTPTRRAAGAGRRLGRRLAVPRRRALPPGAARHARPPVRPRARSVLGAASAELDRAATAVPRRRTRRRTSWSPTSTSCRVAAHARRRRARRRPGATRCAARVGRSASTCAGSTSARTRPCTRWSWPSCWPWPACAPTTGELDERERVARAARRAARPPAAAHAVHRTRRAHRRELAVLDAAADAVDRRGADDHPALRHLEGRVGQRRARGRGPAAGGRARAPGRRPTAPRSTSCRCSRRSTTCSRGRDDAGGAARAPVVPRAGRRRAAARRR